jgi:preflagellin peptidase FlaK
MDAIRLVSAIAILAFASALDWRTRKVPNIYWVLMGGIGLVLIPIQVLADGEDPAYILVLIPVFAILADVYLDSDEETTWARYAPFVKYAIAVLSMVLLAMYLGDDEYFQHLLAVPGMMLLIVALYMLDVIRGGADAKALLSLAVLFPFYPGFDSLPVLSADSPSAEILFPFTFVVLVTAAIIVALFPLAFLMFNLARGDSKFPYSLLGYRIPLADVQKKHVWLMERMKDGKHELRARPIHDEDVSSAVALLHEAGFARVWVTPKIPFIVPMLIGLVISAIVGNILLLIFPL